MLLHLKKTWLILACLIAVVVYFNGDQNYLPGISQDQWEKPQPVKQSLLTEDDLQELHASGKVDTVTYKLLCEALGDF